MNYFIRDCWNEFGMKKVKRTNACIIIKDYLRIVDFWLWKLLNNLKLIQRILILFLRILVMILGCGTTKFF